MNCIKKIAIANFIFLALISTAFSQEDRPGLVRSLEPGVVSFVQAKRDSRSRKIAYEAYGSGYMIDEQGRVITCYHVIEGMRKIKIRLNNGSIVSAAVLKGQTKSDLALLKIEESDKHNFSAQSTRVNLPARGREILVISSPWGLTQSVTNGIVSGVREAKKGEWETGYEGALLQLTAPVSPGSSGGPVFGLDGKVYGIIIGSVSAMFTEVQNINYAIPGKRILEFLLPYYENIARSKNNGENNFNLGRIYDQLNKYGEAEASYDIAIRHDPRSHRYLAAKGILYLTKNEALSGPEKERQEIMNAKRALEYLQAANRIVPHDGKILYNLAVASYKIGNANKAKSYCNDLKEVKHKLRQPLMGNAVKLCSWSQHLFGNDK